MFHHNLWLGHFCQPEEARAWDSGGSRALTKEQGMQAGQAMAGYTSA